MDYDFSYSLGLYIQGLKPSTSGEDPYWGMAAAVAYGLLPAADETFTAATQGELYSANYQNYSATQKAQAAKFVMNGITQLNTFSDYRNFLFQNKQGCILAMKWYPEFMTPNSDGSLPIPNPSGAYSSHCVAVYGYDSVLGLLIKPWLGNFYGQGGYAYMSPTIFQMCFVEGYGFNTGANRLFSCMLIMLQQLQFVINYISSKSTV